MPDGQNHTDLRGSRLGPALTDVTVVPLDRLLTYGADDNKRVTVDNTSTELAASTSDSYREVVVSVPDTADTGVHLAFGEAATTSKYLLQPGRTLVFATTQAINAIRGGTPDVTVDVLGATA